LSIVWITKTGATPQSHDAPGHQLIYHPLLTIKPARSEPARPQKNDILLFTSQNAVQAFCQMTDDRHWLAYTVGDATAMLAKKSGFRSVESAAKDIGALIRLIDKNHGGEQVSFYYPSAAEISADLPTLLNELGFKVTRAIVYKTMANKTPSPALEKCIRNKQPIFALIYSVKGAQALTALGIDTENFDLISLSKNVDAALGDIVANSRKIADSPTHAALLKQLG
jgi:uroporphyrinogen-III synthase